MKCSVSHSIVFRYKISLLPLNNIRMTFIFRINWFLKPSWVEISKFEVLVFTILKRRKSPVISGMNFSLFFSIPIPGKLLGSFSTKISYVRKSKQSLSGNRKQRMERFAGMGHRKWVLRTSHWAVKSAEQTRSPDTRWSLSNRKITKWSPPVLLYKNIWTETRLIKNY